MFTGIITDVGQLKTVEGTAERKLHISTLYNAETIAIGASIACDGICLTVTAKAKGWFEAVASAETLACTTLGNWKLGKRINLERALRMGDELGGHLVSGHIDGMAELLSMDMEGESCRMVFSAPAELMPFIAEKGSVVLNGVSLTVNRVEKNQFSVMIIPHTLAATNLGNLLAGDRVNLEVDLIARYVKRMMEAR